MKIFDTPSSTLQELIPLEPQCIRMYVCGPTVYDQSHIGHGRAYTAYDMVVRYLRWRGYNVTYVRNITDIDDKIIQKAIQEKSSSDDVAQKYTQSFHADLASLGLLPPDHEPKATQTMDEIIRMIQTLIDQGHAYESTGDVYFHVKSFKSYGIISKRNTDELLSGARVATGDLKKDPLDFALWKGAKPLEPSWESPWGQGRPGWHIECSAMAKKILGESIDIHAGGMDLIFPHHENENAQSQCANHKPFAKYWIHNGFVNLSKVKMSKSLGNTVFIKDLLAKAHFEAIRMYLYSSHYRSPIEFSFEDLDKATQAMNRLMRVRLAIKPTLAYDLNMQEAQVWKQKFEAAMDEDFNSPKALAVLFDLARAINALALKKETFFEAEKLSSVLNALGQSIGFFQTSAEHYFKTLPGQKDVDGALIEDLIAQRNEKRRLKDFASADAIRKQLDDLRVVLEDSVEGTSWRLK